MFMVAFGKEKTMVGFFLFWYDGKKKKVGWI